MHVASLPRIAIAVVFGALAVLLATTIVVWSRRWLVSALCFVAISSVGLVVSLLVTRSPDHREATISGYLTPWFLALTGSFVTCYESARLWRGFRPAQKAEVDDAQAPRSATG